MDYLVRISKQGRFHLPVELRKQLGITIPGKVTVDVENNGLVIRAIKQG